MLAPVKEVKRHNQHSQPWITTAILKSIHRKNRLYRNSLKQPKESPKYQQYIAYKRLLSKIIRSAKHIYYNNILREHQNNSKKTWNIINKIIRKTRNKSEITHILHNDSTFNTPTDIADQFNSFFSTVGVNQAQKITHHNASSATINNPFNNQRSIFLDPTNEYEIQKIITKLKNRSSSSQDYISTFHLKLLAPSLTVPLTILFNRCLSEGQFPRTLKLGKVIPIYKKDDKHQMTNYRPITLLPSLSKILEKLIAHRIMNFLTNTDAFDSNQYGFRPNHSTTDAITHLIGHIINENERNKFTLAVFLDFSKAFDTIKHDILLEKLHNSGIRGTANLLIQNYLKNRQQYCEIRNTPSDYSHITPLWRTPRLHSGATSLFDIHK